MFDLKLPTLLDTNRLCNLVMLNMRPSFSFYNIRNISICDFKYFSQKNSIDTFVIQFTYLKNIAFGKFYFWIFNTSRVLGSSFSNHVGNIFRLCSQFQMFRVATRRIVAGVHNYHSTRLVANRNHIGKSMCTNHSVHIRNMKNSIPVFVYMGNKGPTTIWSARFVHFIPKPFFQRLVSRFCRTATGTIIRLPLVPIGINCFKKAATMFTNCNSGAGFLSHDVSYKSRLI